MQIYNILESEVKKGMNQIFKVDIPNVDFQETVKDFEGDLTILIFPFLKYVKGNPADIATKLAEYLKLNVEEIKDFNVVKGFLNISLTDQYFLQTFQDITSQSDFGITKPDPKGKSVMVEYSSPNTNKPLHLGHIRNNLLGYSVAEIIAANGKKVYKTQIINDRGIHICKSMLAWQKFGEGKTPRDLDLKGDKFVGDFYVKFDQLYKTQIQELTEKGISEEEAKKSAPALLEAQEMLIKWEAGDQEVIDLWRKMNGWVYEGFNKTYLELGVDFDVNYYESNTYLLGKDVVQEGLEKGVFYRKEDGSVWIDLTEEGLDEKIVLRADGTAVYMTQDIGTAIQRIKDYTDIDTLVYTVGNEQDYHFKVLFLILNKLGFSWAENLYHLSYGMVDLPSGKMKSREGTVVDADELILEMTNTARDISIELGKLEGYSEEEKERLYKIIGLGALKYYILKVDPKKRILFDPKESIDFNGNTGPFIQYTYARIQSILRKADFDYAEPITNLNLHEKERNLIRFLENFPNVLQQSAEQLSPALMANYTYELVKLYNSFYQTVPILGADNDKEKIFRIQLTEQVGQIIKRSFALLGIEVPERM
ncbi:arginine--tRNA ligase [Namhaeicola litoreus]|uniref:Arginine--tRNA ligase n=1 Tax=Namhaeicola litoreus TaxID=1052145 RepID=A0ABW3Y8J6_9FLAO